MPHAKAREQMIWQKEPIGFLKEFKLFTDGNFAAFSEDASSAAHFVKKS